MMKNGAECGIIKYYRIRKGDAMNQVVGILAHVDAGKTTLSEALLYTTGKIKKLGRVDWRNTYLDTPLIPYFLRSKLTIILKSI